MSSAVQLLIFYHDTYIQSKKRNDHVTIELFILLGSKFQFHQWHTVSTPFSTLSDGSLPAHKNSPKNNKSLAACSLAAPPIFHSVVLSFNAQTLLFHFGISSNIFKTISTLTFHLPFLHSPIIPHPNCHRPICLLSTIDSCPWPAWTDSPGFDQTGRPFWLRNSGHGLPRWGWCWGWRKFGLFSDLGIEGRVEAGVFGFQVGWETRLSWWKSFWVNGLGFG